MLETTGCDRVVCLPGTVCRKTDAACRIGKVCKEKYECVLEGEVLTVRMRFVIDN